MKMIATLAAFAVLAGFSMDASAQDGKKKGERHGKMREALLRKFDKDGDGKLSEQERQAAREFKAKRRAEDGRDGKRGANKRALRKFDENRDPKLDKAERENPRKFRDQRRSEKKPKSRRR